MDDELSIVYDPQKALSVMGFVFILKEHLFIQQPCSGSLKQDGTRL